MNIRKAKDFARREDGAMTAFGLGMGVVSIVIGGLAIDVANSMRVRTQLQVAADAAAHAALYYREFENVDDSKAAALALAEVNMPYSKYGPLITAADIQFGDWDSSTQVFTADPNSKDGVMIDVARVASRNNSVGTYFLKFAGFGSWDIRRAAVFETYIPTCFREGFVAEDVVDVQSNNSYINGFCIHSNTHVEVNSNNYFEDNTVVSMPDKQNIVLPSSGFDSNDGLQDSLRDGSYQLRILNRMQDIIDDMYAGGTDYGPDYISGSSLVTLTTRNLDASDFTSGRINTYSCSGNQSLTLKGGNTFSNVVLVTNCKIKYGNDVILENTVLLTTNTDIKSVTGPHIQIGRDDSCSPDGGSQILTMGGFYSSSHIQVYGGQIIAQDDIVFAANANGIEGASFISGGTISGTSNMTMGFCGDGMERNFEAEYFRLAI